MDKRELDEYIESLWYLTEEGEPCTEDGRPYEREIYTGPVLEELRQQGLITTDSAGKITLTKKGYDASRQIVRCHRLAERLLTDVLGMQPKETEQGACDFEHVIAPEIADSICTLLGHPGECPHGLKIPAGACCRGERDTLSSAIVSLDRVCVGDPVKISYINTLSNTRMHKLAHFGIIPGAEIKVHQKTPAFVLQCGNTQVAMEEDVAKEVYVISPSAEDEPEKPQRRHRWGRGK